MEVYENVGIEAAYLEKVKDLLAFLRKLERMEKTCFVFYLMSCTYLPSNSFHKMSGNEKEGVTRGCFELVHATLSIEIFSCFSEISYFIANIFRNFH